MKTFFLEVVAPAKQLFKCQAYMVTVPGESGSLGIMAGHLPILATLKVGIMHILTESNQNLYFGLTGGFLEMMENHATVLADELLPQEEAEGVPHFTGKPMYFPTQFSGEVQKFDFAMELLFRKCKSKADSHPEKR